MGKIKDTLEPIFRRRSRDSSREAYDRRLEARGYTHDNVQIVDPVPMSPPVGYKKQPSMVDIVREQVRQHHLQMELAAKGVETFEEADDFDVGDPDELPRTIYEMEENFDPPLRKPRIPTDVPEPAPNGAPAGGEAAKDREVEKTPPDPNVVPKA